ncbi:MAG TPA: hypothetical protein PKV33_02290 [Methanothrix sp.]|nr:hypothetical protein [Methanothrix sp.]
MNKHPIVALILLLAGTALILNGAGVSCPFSEDRSSCCGKESCSGNCSLNCLGNCSLNGTCPNEPAVATNNATQENCTALGSCPVKVQSANNGSYQ